MRTDLSKFEARYKVSYPALEWPHTASWNQCRPSWCSLVASSTQGCLLEIDPKKWILRRFLAWFVEEDENENVVKKIVKSSDIQVGVGQIWIQQQSHTSIWRQAVQGVQIVAKRKQPITTAHFMEVLAQTSEEVGRWKPGPETGSQEPFEPTPDHPASP